MPKNKTKKDDYFESYGSDSDLDFTPDSPVIITSNKKKKTAFNKT